MKHLCLLFAAACNGIDVLTVVSQTDQTSSSCCSGGHVSMEVAILTLVVTVQIGLCQTQRAQEARVRLYTLLELPNSVGSL